MIDQDQTDWEIGGSNHKGPTKTAVGVGVSLHVGGWPCQQGPILKKNKGRVAGKGDLASQHQNHE